MPLDPKRVQAVFLEAANCHDLADRMQFLIANAWAIYESRKRIEVLLNAHDRINDFVNQPTDGPSWLDCGVLPVSATGR